MTFKSRTKLIPAVAMLVISAIVLTSASYAWFTMSRTVTASGISLTAIAPTNLLISDEENGTYAEEAIITTSFGSAKLIPASSVEGLNFFAPRAILGEDDGAPRASTYFDDVSDKPIIATPATDGYYADFKLWLKTTGEDDVEVTVSRILSAVTSGAVDPDITGAVRFAILNEDGDGLIVALSKNTYGLTTGGTTNVSWFNTVVGPIAVEGIGGFAGVNIDADINSSNTLFTVLGGPDGEDNAPIGITVRVWIEGQDDDCISDAAAAVFNMVIGFSDVTYAEGIS